jgi:glutathione synthase/RimK-type ligase-like ATP-grasp enzyme
MLKIAIATCQKLPDLTENDRLLIPIFEEKGHTLNAEIWDNPEVQWSAYDLVLIRSTWDYYLKPVEFQSWVSQFVHTKTQLLNSPEIILQNTHKFYLKTLSDKGIAIIPTRFSSDEIAIESLQIWEKVVIKPAISAGSHETEVFETAHLSQETLNMKIGEGDWLIQPFLEEIKESGEISMLFFGGEFSHAIQKVPKSGDFRVQKQFGSQYIHFEPSVHLIQQAKHTVEITGRKAVYARVDGVMTERGFLLMEVEMIEPDLFFEYEAAGPARFVEAVLKAV